MKEGGVQKIRAVVQLSGRNVPIIARGPGCNPQHHESEWKRKAKKRATNAVVLLRG